MVVDQDRWGESCTSGHVDQRDLLTFEELYRASYSDLVALCRHLLRGRGDAEAIAQESFVRAWTSLDRYSAHRPFWPWLATIARRLCIDHRRRAEREETRLVIGASTCACDEGPAPEEALEADEEYRAALQALQALKPAEQRVITLRDINGWSYDEIAAFEGVTVDSIRGSLKRARASLRKSFSKVVGGAPAIVGFPGLRRLRAQRDKLPSHLGSLQAALPGSIAVTSDAAARTAIVLLAVVLGGGGVVQSGGVPAATRSGSAAVVGPPSAENSTAHGPAGQADAESPRPVQPTPVLAAVDVLGHEPALPGDGAETPEDTTVTAFTPSPSYERDGTVFAVGTVHHGCAYASCAALFRSRDRGRSWERLPAAQFEGGRVMLPSRYPEDRRIFVAGPIALQVSTDDGASFSALTPVGGPAAISPRFSDGDPRILLGAAPGWEYRDDLNAVRPGSTMVPSASLTANIVFAPLSWPEAYFLAGGTELSTGGRQTAALFRCVETVCTKVFAAPDVLGAPDIAVGTERADGAPVAAWRSDRLFLSSDGGGSFDEARTPMRGKVRGAAFGGEETYIAMEQVSATGSTGGLFASVDGDRWRALGSSTSLRHGASSVVALADGRLLAAPSHFGGGGLLCSTDRGLTWETRCR